MRFSRLGQCKQRQPKPPPSEEGQPRTNPRKHSFCLTSEWRLVETQPSILFDTLIHLFSSFSQKSNRQTFQKENCDVVSDGDFKANIRLKQRPLRHHMSSGFMSTMLFCHMSIISLSFLYAASFTGVSGWESGQLSNATQEQLFTLATSTSSFSSETTSDTTSKAFANEKSVVHPSCQSFSHLSQYSRLLSESTPSSRVHDYPITSDSAIPSSTISISLETLSDATESLLSTSTASLQEIVTQPSPSSPSVPTSTEKPVSTKERFNYASFDCGALILDSNSESKSATAILQKSRDQYMLNKCAANKFVIVELCDEILIDTVVLGNLEYFSSVFKTFKVEISNRYPPKEGWRLAGEFKAENVRTPQIFAIENALIWARYLKISFIAHYGSEFFCPLSLLRVYGINMMEEMKEEGLKELVHYSSEDPMSSIMPVLATTPPTATRAVDEGSTATFQLQLNTQRTDMTFRTTNDMFYEQFNVFSPREWVDSRSSSASTSRMTAIPPETDVDLAQGSVHHVSKILDRTTASVRNGNVTATYATVGSSTVTSMSNKTKTHSSSSVTPTVSIAISNNSPQVTHAPEIPPSSSSSNKEASIFKTILQRIYALEKSNATIYQSLVQHGFGLNEALEKRSIRVEDSIQLVVERVEKLEGSLTRLIDRLDQVGWTELDQVKARMIEMEHRVWWLCIICIVMLNFLGLTVIGLWMLWRERSISASARNVVRITTPSPARRSTRMHRFLSSSSMTSSDDVT